MWGYLGRGGAGAVPGPGATDSSLRLIVGGGERGHPYLPHLTHFYPHSPIYLTQIACGMHHVAGVASRVSPTGKMPEEGRRTRLVVWGKGSLGQLGTETAKDSCTPQVRV